MRILIATEFFFPSVGGVESHSYNVAYCLSKMGHQVSVLTKQWTDKDLYGIKYINNLIKVYYAPSKVTNSGTIFPSIFSLNNLMLLRNILIRDKIEVIHVHTFTSVIGIIICFLAEKMNIPVVLTDHRYI